MFDLRSRCLNSHRELISGHPPPKSRILQLTRNRLLYRIGLSAAVALGIASVSITHADSTRNANTIEALRAASTAIFFFLTLLQVFQTFLLAQMEITGLSTLISIHWNPT